KFSEWLDQQIEGRFSRAKLTRETKISDGALRNYLSGQTLPDSDQAQRLAETLGINSLQLASMIVANQVADSGGTLADPTPPEEPELEEISASAVASLPLAVAPIPAEALLNPAPAPFMPASSDEEHLLSLWRRLHPQGRRATVQFIATLLAEG
ncbi:MAG: XRE family transcriptional regulator, partial [Oscillochloris sp.]|nr:XRE family transcriptional regulator [Oscillochloris sp.]